MDDQIFVQGLSGYGIQGGELERRVALLQSAGFIELTSRDDEKGEHWTIWYLPGSYAAAGPCKGLKTNEIVSWLMTHVGPGGITYGGQYAGLAPV